MCQHECSYLIKVINSIMGFKVEEEIKICYVNMHTYRSYCKSLVIKRFKINTIFEKIVSISTHTCVMISGQKLNTSPSTCLPTVVTTCTCRTYNLTYIAADWNVGQVGLQFIAALLTMVVNLFRYIVEIQRGKVSDWMTFFSIFSIRRTTACAALLLHFKTTWSLKYCLAKEQMCTVVSTQQSLAAF